MAGTRFKDASIEQGLPDMLIGMDILRHLHLYIAYKEEKLYITPASTPVAVADGAASTAPGPTAPSAVSH